jgi:dTDP-4-amino-4,6-dideoxygalactose transaminase
MNDGLLRREPLPYARHAITAEDVQAVVDVLTGSHMAQGPEAAGFERDLAVATDAGHAVTV